MMIENTVIIMIIIYISNYNVNNKGKKYKQKCMLLKRRFCPIKKKVVEMINKCLIFFLFKGTNIL